MKERILLFLKSGIHHVPCVPVCRTAQEAHHSMQPTSCQLFCHRQGAHVQWEKLTATARVQHQAWRSQCTIPHHFPSTSWGRGRSQRPFLLQQAGTGHLSTREFIPSLQVATLPPLSPMPSDGFVHCHWKMLSCELMCSSRKVLETHISSSEGRNTQSSGGHDTEDALSDMNLVLHCPDCSPCPWIDVRTWPYTQLCWSQCPATPAASAGQMPLALSLPMGGSVTSESVPVFLKTTLTLLTCPLLEQRCSVLGFPRTEQCRKQWPGTRDFPWYCSIRKGNGCYITPIFHMRHRAGMQLPHSCTANQRQTQRPETIVSPILCYTAMVEKGNQPDRPKEVTCILATDWKRFSCLP